MVILMVVKGFLWVKNLEILIQIVPDRSIYYYLYVFSEHTYREYHHLRISKNQHCQQIIMNSREID